MDYESSVDVEVFEDEQIEGFVLSSMEDREEYTELVLGEAE